MIETRTVRIGFNAALLSRQSGYRQSGIGRYLDQLLTALPSALGDNQLITYTGRYVPAPPTAANLTWRRSLVPIERAPVRIAWEQTALPLATRRDRLDLFHGPMATLPHALPCPAVVTIHDLAFLRWPDQVPQRRYRYLAAGVRDAVRRATRIIAISDATKAEIVELLHVDPRLISVTPLAADARFRPADEAAKTALRQRHELKRPYILAVGNLEPRKNLPALLRAFGRIAADVPHNLVLIGGTGWLTDDIHRTLADLRLGDRIRLPGFVADEELPIWYSAADCYVLPSIAEGFGLPVLEAMACGTPVVASNTSSIPEVAGDAAVLVDPRDDAAIAAGIVRVVTEPALAADLRGRGFARAGTFTWDATAAKTVAVYRDAGRGSND